MKDRHLLRHWRRVRRLNRTKNEFVNFSKRSVNRPAHDRRHRFRENQRIKNRLCFRTLDHLALRFRR